MIKAIPFALCSLALISGLGSCASPVPEAPAPEAAAPAPAAAISALKPEVRYYVISDG